MCLTQRCSSASLTADALRAKLVVSQVDMSLRIRIPPNRAPRRSADGCRAAGPGGTLSERPHVHVHVQERVCAPRLQGVKFGRQGVPVSLSPQQPGRRMEFLSYSPSYAPKPKREKCSGRNSKCYDSHKWVEPIALVPRAACWLLRRCMCECSARSDRPQLEAAAARQPSPTRTAGCGWVCALSVCVRPKRGLRCGAQAASAQLAVLQS